MTLPKLFDSHLHIIDGRFPLVVNAGFIPETFTCEDYLQRMSGYELVGGAVVSGSFQAFDQNYLLDALERLGPGFVGVTQLPASVSDEQVLALAAAGVRAVRFNLRRGGSEEVSQLAFMAHRLYGLVGWHVELHADATALNVLFDTLIGLPAVSVDHLGLSREGFPTLLRLVERGVRVKATGFGRVDLDIGAALRELYAANPAALMFGTDLPGTRAPRPFAADDLRIITEALDESGAARVLYQNAQQFYRPSPDA